MAKVALTNSLDQAVPMHYAESTGPRFRWLRRREVIIMDDSRMHQSITDLVSKKHVALDYSTTKDFTTGFEALA